MNLIEKWKSRETKRSLREENIALRAEKTTKSVVKKAGVKTVGTVHVFRRTFATRLAERGCPIEVLQELMGHADPATTLKHYVAKTGTRAKAEWAKYAYVS